MKGRKRLLFGVGLNDADYPTDKRVYWSDGRKRKSKVLWTCPYYARWRDMLKRCYNQKHLIKNPTYVGCTVCEEWLTFSNFKAWMEKQDWEGKSLDKDILNKGNKTYSPGGCVFVEQVVNCFINEGSTNNSQTLIGAWYDKRLNKYTAKCQNPFTKRCEHLGCFTTEHEAHEAWLKRKLEFAAVLAELQTDPRVAKAIINWYSKYEAKK